MSIGIGRNNSNKVRIELRKLDGSYAGSISYTKPSLKKKKRINYNFKAISAQIMQAKTSGNASQVAAKARRKIAMLQRNIRNDEYDQDELEMAIAHAKSLERVARKRVKHLRQEEALKNNGSPSVPEPEQKSEDSILEGIDPEEIFKMSEEELKQLMDELEQAMKELEMEAASDKLTDNLTETVLHDMDPMDLENLKKKHRSDELRDIMEADMRYLRALFNKLAKEKQAAASGSSSSDSSNSGSSGGYSSSSGAGDIGGVSLELSGLEVPVSAQVPAVVEGANMDITV